MHGGKQMIHLILPTDKFLPNEFHKDFYAIDFASLYKSGKRLILTDLDNTLISYEESEPNKQIDDKFEELTKLGFEVILVSNNIQARIDVFKDGLTIQGYGNCRKPLKHGLKKAHKNASKEYSKDQIVVIGDQLMTDVFGANRFGAYSILVNPIKRKTEKWYTRINRRIEEKMLVKIKKKRNEKYLQLELDKRS